MMEDALIAKGTNVNQLMINVCANYDPRYLIKRTRCKTQETQLVSHFHVPFETINTVTNENQVAYATTYQDGE